MMTKALTVLKQVQTDYENDVAAAKAKADKRQAEALKEVKTDFSELLDTVEEMFLAMPEDVRVGYWDSPSCKTFLDNVGLQPKKRKGKRTMSAEAKAKISAAQKARWAKAGKK